MNDDLKTARLQLVISPAEVVEVDEWRRAQPDLPSRSEAIRRLIRAGLEASTPAPQKAQR